MHKSVLKNYFFHIAVPFNGSGVKVPDDGKFSKNFELFGPTVNCGEKHPVVLTTFVLTKNPNVHTIVRNSTKHIPISDCPYFRTAGLNKFVHWHYDELRGGWGSGKCVLLKQYAS